MPELRIKVGASLDASIDTVFGAVEKASKRTRANVQKEMGGLGKSIGDGVKKGASAADKEFAQLEKWAAKASAATAREAAKGAAAQERAAASALKTAERSAAAHEKMLDRKLAAVEKELNREVRLQEAAAAKAAKAAARAAAGGGGSSDATSRFGRRMGYWGLRNFSPVTPTLSMGKRLAGDIARGAGVNFDTGAMMKSFVDRQSMATIIANEGHIVGAKGANGQRQDPGAIMAETSAIAKDVGGSAEEMQAGLRTFVGFTGDLETGRAVMKDMAKISIGMGASMEDVESAAGKVSKNLGDVPNKAEAINSIMMKMAAMGKVGAMPIEAFATELSKLAPMGNKLGGGAAGITKMMVLAQLAQAGGSKDASASATAAVRFVDNLTKGPAQKAWAKQGMSAYTDGKHVQVRDPLELMLDVLSHTKGDQTKISQLFTSGPAKNVLEPLRQAYQKAGGGKAGLLAAEAAYHELADATSDAASLQKDLAAAQDTAKVKVERFNAQLQDIADKTATKVIPAMEAMAPKVLQVANAFGSVVDWFASHSLGEDIAALLTASIAKTSVEQALRVGIENLFSGKNVSAAAAQAASLAKGGGGAGLGGVGAALGVAGAAVAGLYVGKIIADMIVADQVKEQNKVVAGVLDAANSVNETDVGKLTADLAKAQANVEAAKDQGTGIGDVLMQTLTAMGGRSDLNAEQDKEKERSVAMALDSLHSIEAHLEAIKAQGMVTVGQNSGGGVSISRNAPVQADTSGTMPAGGGLHPGRDY